MTCLACLNDFTGFTGFAVFSGFACFSGFTGFVSKLWPSLMVLRAITDYLNPSHARIEILVEASSFSMSNNADFPR